MAEANCEGGDPPERQGVAGSEKPSLTFSQVFQLVRRSPVASCLESSLPGRMPSRLAPTNVGTPCAFLTGPREMRARAPSGGGQTPSRGRGTFLAPSTLSLELQANSVLPTRAGWPRSGFRPRVARRFPERAFLRWIRCCREWLQSRRLSFLGPARAVFRLHAGLVRVRPPEAWRSRNLV